MDYTPPGSSVHGIFQAKILEWVAMSFSRGFSRPVSLASPALAAGFITAPPGKPQPGILLLLLSHFSRVRLFETPWTIPRQAPLSMGFSRQRYWSGLPFPSPADHVLSELSTKTHLSWLALHGMAHSFIELDKDVIHVIRLVSFLCLLFSVCLPLMEKDKRFT